MKVLNLDECRVVIKEINAGFPAKVIAKRFSINLYDVALINRCRISKYPLDEYKLIDDPDYSRFPIYESSQIRKPLGDYLGSQGWDLRMSMRLARLPMSEWANAI
jgi:hypothetical protein|tara:strand:+ start:339 stop:653 length:315 start_codon:yes stop_codon:yes gene_type:complete